LSQVSLHELAKLDDDQRRALLIRDAADLGDVIERVKPIIAAVRADGDQALARFALEFDGAPLRAGAIAATEADFDAAFENLDPAVIEAIEYAVDNIRRFHRAQMPPGLGFHEIRPGAFVGERYGPIPSVACYVPRGKGSFPSMLMMTTIPAVVARVPRIAVVTPPGPDARIDAATLVAARLAGVSDIYKCGGAQAVAAVAYGTQTVPKFHKIVGPGSPYLMAAKRLLAEVIDPGTPAGPSESIVLADASANPRIAALDVIIESEHGPDSSAYLVTDSRALAEAARAAIPEFWQDMGAERVAFSSAVLGGGQGGVVLAPDMEAAIAFVNDYAPEHLEILSDEPFAYLGKIVNAGEILLGEHTPLTLGNFVLGPNAVLPTSGAAKTASPLSVFDYLKFTSVGYVTKDGYGALAKQARVLADYEGFDGHANAVSERREAILDDAKSKSE
jgi:histidinol dehydrogenase